MIRPDRWEPVDQLVLEPNALIAVKEVARNLALTAGPGAGKTEMLAQRADFLLRTGACRYPKRILAISFKVDASQNLKERVKKRCGFELATRFDSYTFHAFAKRIIDRFRPVLTGQDALDRDYTIGPQRIYRRSITFNDMVPLAVAIVASSGIARRAIQRTYSHVFLDEFQDCTDAQYGLIKACFEGTTVRLTAVGDTKQRIMGWAGALEGVFESYADDFAALRLNLYQNFRSKPRLRRMQNAMVRVMDPPAAVDDETIAGADGIVEILRFDNDAEEAENLAQNVSQWIEDGVDPTEIAILVRQKPSLFCQRVMLALQAIAVPVREDDASQDLAAEPVARLIIDFLLVVNGCRVPEPHQRLLGLLVFGNGYDEEREYRERSRWGRFVTSVRRGISDGDIDLSDRGDVDETVAKLLEQVGREAVVALSTGYSDGAWLDQKIREVTQRAHELIAESDDAVAALLAFSGDSAVRVMSIHKSKGLEFDSVVVQGVEMEAFWGRDVAAERSTFFVAISRAKRQLILTSCEHRDRPQGAQGRWDENRREHEEFIGFAEMVN